MYTLNTLNGSFCMTGSIFEVINFGILLTRVGIASRITLTNERS